MLNEDDSGYFMMEPQAMTSFHPYSMPNQQPQQKQQNQQQQQLTFEMPAFIPDAAFAPQFTPQIFLTQADFLPYGYNSQAVVSEPSASSSPDATQKTYQSPQSVGTPNDSSTGPKHDEDDDDDDDDLDDGKRFTNKDARNAAERKRRAKMNDTLGTLKTMVPSLYYEKKPSKAMIYKKTVEYLCHVENQMKNLRTANEEYQHKLEALQKSHEQALQRMKELADATQSVSPIQPSDFEALLSAAKDEQSWAKVASGSGIFGLGDGLTDVTVWRKHSDVSSISLTKSSCFIPVPVETVITVLLDLKNRKNWDASLIDVKSLGPHRPNQDEVFYMAVKSPSGLSNRDYVKVRKFMKLDNGAYAVIEKSTTHPNFPPKKGLVRGEVILAGHLIEPVEGNPNCSLVTMLSEIDLKGNIPAPVVNFLTTRAPFSWFDAFSSQAKDCSGDLVHCLTTTILRIAIA